MAIPVCKWPTSFYHANEKLGDKATVRIGNDTYLKRLFSGEIVATFHGNPIVSYMPGDYAVSNAGWNTITTSGRLHDALMALHKGNIIARHNVKIKNSVMLLDQETPITEEWLSVK